MKPLNNKKGQIGNLQGIITVLAVVGILIGAGFFIFEKFQDQMDNYSATVENETGGYINSTGYTLDESDTTGFNSLEVTEVRNATDGTTIASGNYTVSDEGVITNATATTYADVNVDYNYEYGRNGYQGMSQTITAMLTVPNLLGLVVLIAVIGIILAVVFNVIPGRGSNRIGSSA